MEEQNDRKKVQKVITGEVKTKKKSSAALALQHLGVVPDDIEDVKDYIIKEQIVPAAKNLFFDMLQTIIFGGDYKGRSGRRSSRTSYESYYDDRRDRGNSKRGRSFNYDELIFDSRGDAEEVLDQMSDMIHRYPTVSVADLYDAAGVTCPHTYNYYGWDEEDDINRSRVVRTSNGYVIKLPRPRPID